jgi:hypothetical protein
MLHTADSPFAPLAARRLILAEMAAQRGQITELATLDALHELALAYDIVTPYSSMIVLVNAEQRRMLEQLSAQDDRFERAFEELGNTTPPPVVTGVPEPEEWLPYCLDKRLLVHPAIKKASTCCAGARLPKQLLRPEQKNRPIRSPKSEDDRITSIATPSRRPQAKASNRKLLQMGHIGTIASHRDQRPTGPRPFAAVVAIVSSGSVARLPLAICNCWRNSAASFSTRGC